MYVPIPHVFLVSSLLFPPLVPTQALTPLPLPYTPHRATTLSQSLCSIPPRPRHANIGCWTARRGAGAVHTFSFREDLCTRRTLNCKATARRGAWIHLNPVKTCTPVSFSQRRRPPFRNSVKILLVFFFLVSVREGVKGYCFSVVLLRDRATLFLLIYDLSTVSVL